MIVKPIIHSDDNEVELANIEAEQIYSDQRLKVSKNPTSWQTHCDLAAALSEIGRNSEAKHEWETAFRLDRSKKEEIIKSIRVHNPMMVSQMNFR